MRTAVLLLPNYSNTDLTDLPFEELFNASLSNLHEFTKLIKIQLNPKSRRGSSYIAKLDMQTDGQTKIAKQVKLNKPYKNT